MDENLFSRPGHLINRAARLLNRWGDSHFQELGLAIAQLPVLGALRDGRSLTQKELVKLVPIEQSSMAQLLNRMERDGLIARTPDPDDKRSSRIALTPAAMGKLPRAKALLLEGNAKALTGFTEKEIATLSRLLWRVVKNLDPNAEQVAAAMSEAPARPAAASPRTSATTRD